MSMSTPVRLHFSNQSYKKIVDDEYEYARAPANQQLMI